MPEMKEDSFEVVGTIICDDIREEKSGKHILIGVYGGEIGVPGFPIDMGLFIRVDLRPSTPGRVPIGIRVIGPNNAQLFLARMTAAIGQNVPYLIPLMLGPVGVQFQ